MATTGQPKLRCVVVTFDVACAYVATHHRHHRPPQGHKFSFGVVDEDDVLRGIAMVGRPVGRSMDDGLTLEVIRIATDGCANACSALLGQARKAAKALCYERIITYTLVEESGTSLAAAGWIRTAAQTGGGSWSNASRPRTDMHPLGFKQRWEGWPPIRGAGLKQYFADQDAKLASA